MSSDLQSVLRGVVSAVRLSGSNPAGLRQAIGALSDAALVADNRGKLVIVNAAALSLTGYAHDELLSLYVPDITGFVDRKDFEPLWRAFIRVGHQRGTYELHTRGGRPVSVEYAAASNVTPGLHLSLLRGQRE